MKTGRINPGGESISFLLLVSWLFDKIDKGDIVVTGRGQHGELVVEYAANLNLNVWNDMVWKKVLAVTSNSQIN